ncbi:histidine--tRNA ligase [Bradyrhizobium sp. CIAT3101]|uniref:histidine--tRNA ligase n=1 Tax=Bradyrhizobium sp. CIAT3101 TaxID=439387 RepID=UPI0024B06CA1|nr:histidine--tRNA ligase [Bradyrhizobium sp. CIAT3101]WFU80067.1 histidine--tRNA ligase [Bradyrhizobium sp. CIAT3101]
MAEKPKKPQKLKARLPRGLEDRDPAAIRATREMVEKIRAVYELYGFEPVETPAMEYTDALGKFLPDQDRPNEGVFSFQDDDEQWISLRYDLTAPLARYVGERYGTDGLVLPYRSYRVGYVFRNEKPGPGRFRQFMQFDADTVGSATPAADAEICMMAADTMEALGVARGQYVVKVNNRKILDGVLEACGLKGDENAGRRLTVLRAIDKLDRLGIDGVKLLLSNGRWDGGEEGKGDFTPGAGLSSESIEIVLDYITSTGDDAAEKLDRVRKSIEKVGGDISGTSELTQILYICDQAGYSKDQIAYDPSVVRGLEYYTGPVYEVELLLETKDEKGRPVRFGSVGGGGRYDGLVSRFRGEPVPATGFSIGVSRLQAALTLLGKLDSRPEVGPVVVTVFDRDRVADYQKMVASLRNAGIRAELYLGNPKNMGNQLKYADRRNSPCVIIQGADELNDPEGPQVIIKDLWVGSTVTDVEKDRDRYLQAQKLIQQKVPASSLVDEVRKLLRWHHIEPPGPGSA